MLDMLAKLTENQRALVEANMWLVGKVIADCVHALEPGSLFAYEDLQQIGCVGLCKAAQHNKPGHEASFSTYAYVVIRNEIFMALEYAGRRSCESAAELLPLPSQDDASALDAELEEVEACSDLLALLSRAEEAASGSARKGVQAIRLLALGYTNREIGERYGVPANHVTAWVAKARKLIAALLADGTAAKQSI